ncbi:MAG: hypothetical protein ABI533_06360 [Betaproteobacteria bacterium]
MQIVTMATLAMMAVAVSGCETLNRPQAMASTEAPLQECKAVSVTGGERRKESEKDSDVDSMQRRENRFALERQQLKHPTSHRSLISQALRDCY